MFNKIEANDINNQYLKTSNNNEIRDHIPIVFN